MEPKQVVALAAARIVRRQELRAGIRSDAQLRFGRRGSWRPAWRPRLAGASGAGAGCDGGGGAGRAGCWVPGRETAAAPAAAVRRAARQQQASRRHMSGLYVVEPGPNPARLTRIETMPNAVKTALLLGAMSALLLFLGEIARRRAGSGHRLRVRRRHQLRARTGSPTRSCCRCTGPAGRTRVIGCTASSRAWRSAPACRCRRSTSSRTRRRTRSPPAATPARGRGGD